MKTLDLTTLVLLALCLAQPLAASEFVGARNGLGWFIWSSWQTLQVERMYVGIIAISLLGYLTLQLIYLAELRVVPWAHRH